jgi:UDP-3-O-[3-hydroxymyristoyl] glucosamine N-acyltransferase
MKLGEIARRLGCELVGPAELEITGVAGIEEAAAQHLTFVSNPKYIPKLKTTRAGAVVVGRDTPPPPVPILRADDPYVAFARAIELFYQPPRPIPGIHPTASIARTAALGEDCSIGANVVISEGVKIGRRCVLHSNVTIYPYAEIGDDFTAHSNAVVREFCKVGNRVILQNGAVVGADGFGFAPQPDRPYYKIIQSGIVVLEDDVEIGANSCVDRATVGETRIRRGAKLDNLVQVGHGSTVGEDTLLAAQVGLAGSTRVGNRVFLAGQVGAAGHLTIGDRVVAIAQSGIPQSVEPDRIISGSPAVDFKLWKKNSLLMERFPELVQTIRELKKEVEELRTKLKQERED